MKKADLDVRGKLSTNKTQERQIILPTGATPWIATLMASTQIWAEPLSASMQRRRSICIIYTSDLGRVGDLQDQLVSACQIAYYRQWKDHAVDLEAASRSTYMHIIKYGSLPVYQDTRRPILNEIKEHYGMAGLTIGRPDFSGRSHHARHSCSIVTSHNQASKAGVDLLSQHSLPNSIQRLQAQSSELTSL